LADNVVSRDRESIVSVRSEIRSEIGALLGLVPVDRPD
jgi:hypothetical protein